MNRTTSPDLALALEAAREAGAAVMRHFRRLDGVRFKGPDQPVTAADLEADRILRERLGTAGPEYGWLSEETADSAARLGCRRVWVVDPIDGTNSFVEGRPEFVLSIGLVEDGLPTLAVLLNPATDELYHAARGAGAFRNGEPLRVAPAPPAGERPVLLVSRTEQGRGELAGYERDWHLVPLGSTAYRMLKVAEGVGHAFLSRGLKNEWDLCGASLVVEEAGGRVTQWDGSGLRFNQPDPVFRGVIASNGLPGGLPAAGRHSQ